MKYKIEDLLEKVIDNRGKTPPISTSGYMLLEINSLTGDNKYPNYGAVHKNVSKETYNTWFRSGHPQADDILIPTVGTLDALAYLNRDDCCIAQNIVAFRTKKEICDGNFLYYLLRDKRTRTRLLNLNIGGVQPSIKVPHLKQLEVEVPDLETQQKIVRILSVLDQKIELNNNENSILQLIIDTQYCKVFSGNEKNNKVKASDLFDYEGGYSYTSVELVDESNIGMMTIKNFERTGGFKADGFKALNPKKGTIKTAALYDIFISCTDVTQNADIIGNAVMLLDTDKYSTITYSMDLVRIIPKINRFALYAILNSKDFKNYALGYKSGTTVLHLNKKCLAEYEIALPDEKSLDVFGVTIEKACKKIAINLTENRCLSQIRDSLLPKLMSGDVNLDKVTNG